MRLTPEIVAKAETMLTAYYATFIAQSERMLGYLRGTYPNVKAPRHLDKVLPPIARRVVYGLAQQIPTTNRVIHCDPAENSQGRATAKSQENSSLRENALRVSFAQDDAYALRRGRYPPSTGVLIESLLFGLSAGVVLPEELALRPKPVRRAGEGAIEFQRRERMWEMDRATIPALPWHLPGILNLLIDPGGEMFIWRFRLPGPAAAAILDRWGLSLPSSAYQVGDQTVVWKEAYSAETRIVYVGGQPVKTLPGYGFLPLALCNPARGEPVVYVDSGGALGAENLYQGVLAGCESIMDDIARKETQLANFITKRVWPKQYLQGNVPAKFELNNDPTVVSDLPEGVVITVPPTGELPKEVWSALKHGLDYIDSVTQIDSLQGYKPAESGYQQAILSGLAAAVLRPYVRALDGTATEVALLRLKYVMLSDYFLGGLELRARVNGETVAGMLSPETLDSLQVEVTHHVRLAQQKQTEEAFWRAARTAGAISRRRYQEEGLGIEDPEAEDAQRRAEDWLDSPEVQKVITRDMAMAYDADLARRIEEVQGESLQRLGEAIQQNQPPMGGGLAPPGLGLPIAAPAQAVGQPPALTPEQEADLVVRQVARRGLPVGRR